MPRGKGNLGRTYRLDWRPSPYLRSHSRVNLEASPEITRTQVRSQPFDIQIEGWNPQVSPHTSSVSVTKPSLSSERFSEDLSSSSPSSLYTFTSSVEARSSPPLELTCGMVKSSWSFDVAGSERARILSGPLQV